MIPEHKHMIVRSEVNNPPMVKMLLSLWVKELVEKLGMKLLSGPHVSYVHVPGNRGITCVCIIETSHIAMHVWDEQSPALLQLDVYTCGSLDPKIVLDMLKEFEPVKIEYKYLDREHALHILE
jgi:S-adenosylmethionine/arginine decarboxylase-like enzyme